LTQKGPVTRSKPLTEAYEALLCHTVAQGLSYQAESTCRNVGCCSKDCSLIQISSSAEAKISICNFHICSHETCFNWKPAHLVKYLAPPHIPIFEAGYNLKSVQIQTSELRSTVTAQRIK